MALILSDFMTEYALKAGVVLLIGFVLWYFIKLFKDHSRKNKGD